MKNILIVIDELEFKYFEFNKLITNFWLVYEYLNRDYKVFVTTKNKLFQKNNIPYGILYESFIQNDNIFKHDQANIKCLNNFEIIFYRPDPPVDINYLNATQILSYVDKNTIIMNSPKSIREKNEKLYINEFQGLIPENIVSADEKIIKDFLFEKKEIILKPTNQCFGSGVFYLSDKDKNINTIIRTITNEYKTQVMIQEFLPQVKEGDKRLIYICGELFNYGVRKIATNNDFKFNEHNSNTLKAYELSEKEKSFLPILREKFEHDGIYLAGLDTIDDKIIEINITSPCFFINEINNLFDIHFEKLIVDKIESYVASNNKTLV